ncbi:acyl-CoA dehydrogenase family protein [Sphingobium sp. TKS]|uniref:acyl-CoA dehydrogenase family protein n=1 Tax=Sphingobium sp. TKS TaxID=1315974 RepID=UPI0007704224|nr:acyl-CoA dehydrogenase family protein [Sphingobium sp. TKS]AMK25628.1 acyl-CoA dehydrogenase-like protein [Sphingobium sp. TKS]
MDLHYTAGDIAFRQAARQWLSTNVPVEPRPADVQGGADFDRTWQRKLYDGGWAGVNWPKEFGGLGLSGVRTLIWWEECERAKAPGYERSTIALTHAGPTLITRGSEAQKAFHLPRILKGEVLWCQGFSEPGAGSDLAALKTKGTIDGDYLVVNGQKTWTSGAATARYQELLVRTEPGSERHKGLTWIICDMTTPGIEVCPIKTMMGESDINATFYDDVRIPLTNVVGEIGGGWSIALSTLDFERGNTFLRDQISMSGKVERAIELARRTPMEDGRYAIEDREIARKLAELKADALGLRAMAVMNVSNIDRKGSPGPEGSMVKLLVSQTNKQLNEVVAEIVGQSLLDYDGTKASNEQMFDYMWGWVLTIAGGATEIQKEIIADRVLQLPRSR